MPIVSIRHRTSYRYSTPVGFGEHRLLVRPMEAHDQRLLAFALDAVPEPALVRELHDVSGATVMLARFEGRSATLTFDSRATVEHAPAESLDLVSADAYVGSQLYDPEERRALAPALQVAGQDNGVVESWARRFLRPLGRTHVATWLGDVTHAIRDELTYEVRLSGPPQTPSVTLERGRGSCRDFAVLLIEAARTLGFAAEFASGYVYGSTSDYGRGHTHAWARVFLPRAGWTDYDPTNGIIGGPGLIRTATSPDPLLTLPLHGAFRGQSSDFVSMDVEIELQVETARQPPAPLRVAARGY